MEKDILPQYLRCYVEPKPKEKEHVNTEPQIETPRNKNKAELDIERIGAPYHGYCFVFDTETSISLDQSLKVGCYAIFGISTDDKYIHYKNGSLTREVLDSPVEIGMFYDAVNLTEAEIKTIKEFTERNKFPLHTKLEFITDVFYEWVYHKEALCIGHNLAFDISRLANSFSQSRGTFKGGFTFKLCECKPENSDEAYDQCFKHPNIRIKHISGSKNLYDFQGIYKTGKKNKKGKFDQAETEKKQGKFLDTRTFGKALLGSNTPGSLKAMGAVFRADIVKSDAEEHGKINDTYLKYNINDVLATFSLYQKQIALYKEHGRTRKPWQIFSEASLGKAYLDDMNFPIFLKKHANISKKIIGNFMSAYYGGRAEVKCRNQLIECIYADFKSQYPTVNALMDLQSVLLAEEIEIVHNVDEVKLWIDTITAEVLQNKNEWHKLRGVCQVLPQNDILPLRSTYSMDDSSLNIGLNEITSPFPTWYTIADVIVSKLLTGKTPEIVDVMTINARGRVETKPINLFGRDDYVIDLNKSDLFTSVINLRTEVRKKVDQLGKDHPDYEYLSNLQNGLKLLANSTSYGVALEVTPSESDNKKPGYAYTDKVDYIKSNKLEKPGKYFNGLIGPLITAGGRLLLGIAEHLANQQGIRIAMTDTDSAIFAKPKSMNSDEFRERIQSILDFFNPLSPYDDKGALFELEDSNFKGGKEKNGHKPLFFVGVSAKRYALCNLRKVKNGFVPVMRAVKEHGFTMENPKNYYSEYSEVEDEFLHSAMRWKRDLWFTHINNILNGTDKRCEIAFPNYHQYTLSTWHLYKIYKGIPNIKPFNFFLSFPSLKYSAGLEPSEHPDAVKEPTFYSPLEANLNNAFVELYRHDTHEKVRIDTLLLQDLAGFEMNYFTHSEKKSIPSDGTGWLERRKAAILEQIYIGKEYSEKHGSSMRTGGRKELTGFAVDIGVFGGSGMRFEFAGISTKQLSKATGIDKRTLDRIAALNIPPNDKTRRLINKGLSLLRENPEYEKQRTKKTRVRFATENIQSELEHALKTTTINELSRLTGVDKKTISSALSGENVTPKTAQKICDAISIVSINSEINIVETLKKASEFFSFLEIAKTANIGLRTIYNAYKGVPLRGTSVHKLLNAIDYLLKDRLDHPV